MQEDKKEKGLCILCPHTLLCWYMHDLPSQKENHMSINLRNIYNDPSQFSLVHLYIIILLFINDYERLIDQSLLTELNYLQGQ